MENLKEPFHIARLIAKSFYDELTRQEKSELDSWLVVSTNRKLYESLRNKDLEAKRKQEELIDLNDNWQKIKSRISFKKRRRISHRIKYAAAIALPILIATFYLFQRQNIESYITTSVILQAPQPGSSKAVLVLADGKQIDLSQQLNHCHPNDSTVIFRNRNNTLTVEQEVVADIRPIDYQTIFIPIGGEYRLVLSDGTKVWLNSDTRLRFPASFSDQKRIVYLEGEAYFEVTPNKQQPFIVKTREIDIEVLGTKFDVKAYGTDSYIYATLAEGSIKTTALHEATTLVLSPNQQCQYVKTTGQMKKKNVDAQLFIGWTKGKFIFENETLEEIMNQLGRWYDTKVSYQSPELKSYRFTGYVDRFDDISTILRMIEKTYDITFNIQGQNIVILNKNSRQ